MIVKNFNFNMLLTLDLSILKLYTIFKKSQEVNKRILNNIHVWIAKAKFTTGKAPDGKLGIYTVGVSRFKTFFIFFLGKR
jgi:hypothetical protein